MGHKSCHLGTDESRNLKMVWASHSTKPPWPRDTTVIGIGNLDRYPMLKQPLSIKHRPVCYSSLKRESAMNKIILHASFLFLMLLYGALTTQAQEKSPTSSPRLQKAERQMVIKEVLPDGDLILSIDGKEFRAVNPDRARAL